jgi:hypothetical protein
MGHLCAPLQCWLLRISAPEKVMRISATASLS